MLEAIEIRAKLEQLAPNLPRHLVIPAKFLAAWELVGTTSIEAWLNGRPLGRRTLKRRDDERWFVELTQPQCAEAHVDVGAEVSVRIRLAGKDLPVELERMLRENAAAKGAWDARSSTQQRALQEHVATARFATTRWNRAAAGLAVTVPAPPDLVARRPRRDPERFQVEVHEVPVAEDELRTPSRGLDLLAAWIADEIFCESWLETLQAAGEDPLRCGPPPELRSRSEVWEQFLGRQHGGAERGRPTEE